MIKNNILLHRKRFIPLIHNALTEKYNGYHRNGYLFEKVLAEIYRGKGYDTLITGGTDDGGVDLIAEKGDMRIAIQAKNYNNNMTKTKIRKNDMITIFNKIKYIGENKYGTFTNARLHVYNDNIVSIRPYFMEDINHRYQYCLDDKGIYGKLWIDYQIENINDDAFNKISQLIL